MHWECPYVFAVSKATRNNVFAVSKATRNNVLAVQFLSRARPPCAVLARNYPNLHIVMFVPFGFVCCRFKK